MKAKFAVENGTFFYEKKKPVLRDVSFSAQKGEIIAVLGPNGAGKTTLLKCLTGMMPWKSGRSLLDGKDIAEMPYRKLWSSLSYVPQTAGSVPAYTGLEMVLLGRSGHIGVFSAPGKEDIGKAEEAMEMLGVGYLSGKSCCEVSGGELQMIRIARALASEPEVLVLDEPEANLDFKNKLIVLDALTKLSGQGITCIFNTHEPSHALQRASHALLFFPDGTYRFGKTDDIVTEEYIRRAFGVEAVIGETENDGKLWKNVVPLHIAAEHKKYFREE